MNGNIAATATTIGAITPSIFPTLSDSGGNAFTPSRSRKTAKGN